MCVTDAKVFRKCYMYAANTNSFELCPPEHVIRNCSAKIGASQNWDYMYDGSPCELTRITCTLSTEHLKPEFCHIGYRWYTFHEDELLSRADCDLGTSGNVIRFACNCVKG